MVIRSIQGFVALVAALAGAVAVSQDVLPPASKGAFPAPMTDQALQLQPDCMKIYVYGLPDRFKAQSKVALPNCYTDPQDSAALVELAQLLEHHPKEASAIARIMRSWTDNRAKCSIKQTAYTEAVGDVRSYLKGSLPLKEATSGSFEGVCAAPNPFTTTCRTIGGSTTCMSGGGGMPSSQMVCRSDAYSSTCTFSGN